MLDLMLRKMAERKERERSSAVITSLTGDRVISDIDFFRLMGNSIEVNRDAD